MAMNMALQLETFCGFNCLVNLSSINGRIQNRELHTLGAHLCDGESTFLLLMDTFSFFMEKLLSVKMCHKFSFSGIHRRKNHIQSTTARCTMNLVSVTQKYSFLTRIRENRLKKLYSQAKRPPSHYN